MTIDQYHINAKIRQKRQLNKYQKSIYDDCDNVKYILDMVKQESFLERMYFKKNSRINVKNVRQTDIVTFNNMYEIVNCAYEDLILFKKKGLIKKIYEVLK